MHPPYEDRYMLVSMLPVASGTLCGLRPTELVGPDGWALLQERRHPLPSARALRQRRHHLDGDRVRVGLGPVELRVEGLLADALAEPTATGGARQQFVDPGVQLGVRDRRVHKSPIARGGG